ncbi:MAG: discoidin domain-containing protein, partial [candidate division Zixibacteria bacterium]|nr:discoidin domain-containing protein [candidate division Zixibacteria bacterium]
RQFHAAGNIAQAREALIDLSPSDVIENYARFSSLGGITRGEQGLVASMNLRWLTHYVRHYQMLLTEPVRYNFAPTSHDPLAQSMGTFTFHIDRDGDLWECFGTKETKADVSVLDDDRTITRSDDTPAILEEICRTRIEFDKSRTVTIQPIMAKGGRGGNKSNMLAPGRYRLDLLMLDPVSTKVGQRVFDIELQTESASNTCRFKPVRTAYLRLACNGNSTNDWNSIHEVRIDSLDHSYTIASASMEGYPASAAVDGKAETRWAAQGRNHWIQLKLDPTRDTDRIEIDWYDADRRTARFEILVSDDGQQWKPVERRQSASRTIRDRIDIFAQTQQRSKILKCSYDLALASPGVIDLRITPITGKATLCGLVLTPILDEPVKS